MRRLAVLSMLSTLLLAGCGSGLDKKVNWEDEGEAIDDVRQIMAELSPQEQAAVRWTLTLMSQGVEPSEEANTLRKMMRETAETANSNADVRIKELEEQDRVEFAPRREALAKVRIENAAYHLPKRTDWFDDKLTLTWTVTNGSAIPMSKLALVANLYINGNKEPAAKPCAINDYYRFGGERGLRAGETYNRNATLGASRDCRDWNTLEIAEAHARLVEIKVVNAEDFSEHELVNNELASSIQQLKDAKVEATSVLAIVKG